MAVKVTPRLIELVYESALKSFWRKAALKKFLRASHVADNFISTWANEESKREFLDRVFGVLQSSDRGKAVIYEMAKFLSEQISFPDLNDWEDSKLKIANATTAVNELKKYLKLQGETIRSEREREDAKAKARDDRQKIQRSLTDKSKLQHRLDALHKEVGTQAGGYAFEKWFFDLLDFCEIPNRRPYIASGRQIDGSLTFDGTTYLVELKFTSNQSNATDIDSLRSKVDDKADNTMGIMVSISGYSSVAINQASGRKTTLLLLDGMHIYMFLSGSLSLRDIISRVRRHASQTGESYLEATKFGG